jgi:hypothetical protein
MARHGLSLIDIQTSFGSEEKCAAYLEAARWPEGVRCLKCESDRISCFKTNETVREYKNKKGEVREVKVPARLLYQCNSKGCRHQFSATAGTIFDKTHLPLASWFMAIGIVANAKKSVSAKQMQRDLGVNYRTAWHLDHRIREAMQDPKSCSLAPWRLTPLSSAETMIDGVNALPMTNKRSLASYSVAPKAARPKLRRCPSP